MLKSTIGTLLLASSLIAANNVTPAIRSFDIATLEHLGNEMYEQDVRAARATDIVRAERVQFREGFLRGWIVSKQGSTQIVRFIGEEHGVLMAAADVTFQDATKGKLTQYKAVALTGTELNQAKARLLVAKDVEHLPELCSRTYNLIALPDPDGSGFLIWAIAANTTPTKFRSGDTTGTA